MRPANRRRRYRNLYFAGAGSDPGTGLPIVFLSARQAPERILHEAGEPQTAGRLRAVYEPGS